MNMITSCKKKTGGRNHEGSIKRLTVSEYTWYVCGVVLGCGGAGGSGCL